MRNKIKFETTIHHAEYLVKKNIWPSSIMIDKLFGKMDTNGDYSRHILRKWKDKIGLKRFDGVVMKDKSFGHKNTCGIQCADYTSYYQGKILCPIHFTVKDV
jgi:hypothetical protein